ncbi:hypothetical protein C1645_856458 [Glomus cerebriforme]|uniref:CCHC-type domain-containing protein n=1 Tax=Glomus cerebriforme TaxID=658196 RepID=A0A397SJB9_9GLOM|nr:hypothetical protein C1645_856458 [Glomus cerebriforme]
MSPNKYNQVRRQQPHRSVKESNVNTVLGSSSHQRAKSPVPKSLSTSQVHASTSLAKEQDIIAQTYGTSSNSVFEEEQRSYKRVRQQEQPQDNSPSNNNTSSSSTPRDPHMEDTSTSVVNPVVINTAKRTNFSAIAPFDFVKGNSPRAKIQTLTKIFARFSSYTGATSQIIKKLNKEKYMRIFFLNEDDLLNAIKLPITKSVKTTPSVTDDPNNTATPVDQPDQSNPDSVTPPQFYFTKFSEVVPTIDPSAVNDTNQRTVQVIDIPLGMKAHTVRASLSRFGEIDTIKLVTRGLFQHAFITYQSVTAAQSFVTLWGTYILRDAVRVFPKFLTDEQRQLRKKFGCKLTGLPNNIQARDLHDILSATHAKSIFIPRNPVSYKPLNFAYINFDTEDAKTKAMKTNYKVNGRDLFWCTENARTCNRCGSPSHLFNECPARKLDSKKQQLNKLYNRYRPAQHRKPKSYADAAKSHKDTKSRDPESKGDKPQNQQKPQPRSSLTLNGGTQQGGSIHGAQSEKFTAMYNEVLKTMKQIDSRLSIIDNKIFHLERRATKQPASLSPHARELAAKNSPQHNEQINLQEINALKKESSETRSLTNSCVNILKQMQSFMGMDTPADDDEVIDDHDLDDDEDEHMDNEEYDDEGFLKEPTEDNINNLYENWGN